MRADRTTTTANRTIDAATHRFGRRRRARSPHRSLVESWTMLFDDPPALCCTDDHLCAACALDAGDPVTSRA